MTCDSTFCSSCPSVTSTKGQGLTCVPLLRPVLVFEAVGLLISQYHVWLFWIQEIPSQDRQNWLYSPIVPLSLVFSFNSILHWLFLGSRFGEDLSHQIYLNLIEEGIRKSFPEFDSWWITEILKMKSYIYLKLILLCLQFLQHIYSNEYLNYSCWALAALNDLERC